MVVALTSCVDGAKSARWPGHRKDHDARLDKLAQQVDDETQQIALLTKRIADLESQLAHAPPAEPAPAPPPPAPPAPSGPPIPASDLSH